MKLQDIMGFLNFCIYYLSPGPIIIFISYLITRRKIKWYASELIALILPFLIWVLLVLINIKVKSLSNIIESMYISLGIGAINILSIFIYQHDSAKKPIFDIIASTLLAIIIYFAFPMIPE